MKKVNFGDALVRKIVSLSFVSYILYSTLFFSTLFLMKEMRLFSSHLVANKGLIKQQATSLPLSQPESKDDDNDEVLEKTDPAQIAKRDTLTKLFKEGYSSSVFAVVDAIEKDESIVHNCHEIAHDLGHTAYKLYGFGGAMNFTDIRREGHITVQDMCAGGYVHGVLEEASVKDKNFLDHPSTLCDAVSPKSKDGCFHGVGHALMFLHKRDVTKSLESCRLRGNQNFNSRCFEGVWMELFWGNGASIPRYELGFNKDDPFEICSVALSDTKRACFLYAVRGYLRFHPKEYQTVLQKCTEGSLVTTESIFCLKGVGITMNFLLTSGDFEKVEDYVSKLSYAQRYAYYQGVFGYAMFAGRDKQDILSACGKMKRDSALCKDVVNSRY